MTIWDLGWIMMLLAAHAQQWSTVQTVKGWSTTVILTFLRPMLIFWETLKFDFYIKRNAGSFHVGQAKMENLMLLNGMKMKV